MPRGESKLITGVTAPKSLLERPGSGWAVKGRKGKRTAKGAKEQRSAPTRPRQDRMNKTEALYAQELELRRLAGEIIDWKFGAVKLRLADNTHYTPDFLVVFPDGQLCFDETKGFERDDAVVKFKLAAELFPYWRFRMIKREKDAWKVTRDLNIGREDQ